MYPRSCALTKYALRSSAPRAFRHQPRAERYESLVSQRHVDLNVSHYRPTRVRSCMLCFHLLLEAICRKVGQDFLGPFHMRFKRLNVSIPV